MSADFPRGIQVDFVGEDDEFVGWGGEERDSHAERFRFGTHERRKSE